MWAVTSPGLTGKGGVYCENCDVATVTTERSGERDISDGARLTGVMPYAIDPGNARRCWTMSEELLGLRFPQIAPPV